MKNYKKIGIMGGTFDPPHLGHLISAEYVAEALGLDSVVFIPTGKKVYKESSAADAADRMNMTIAAVGDNPKFSVSDTEVLNEGVNYTSETLERLHNANPNAHFYFIVGADSLDYMEDWHNPKKIFELCTVAAVQRKGFDNAVVQAKADFLKERYGADIECVQAPVIEVSSSQIRERIKSGLSIKYLVCDAVKEYIENNGLYR